MSVRGLFRLVAGLVVLALLLAAADRVANVVAEQQAARALASALGTEPDVRIGGFPFLTQWASGRYGMLAVSSDHATVGGTQVDDVRLRFADVRTQPYLRGGGDIAGAKAGSVRMSAVVPYGQLPLPSGVHAKRASDPQDEIKLSGTVSILGSDVRISALLELSARHGKARLTPHHVRVLGPMPSQAITSLVRQNLAVTVDPPGLPPGMHVTSLAVAGSGILVKAAGSDVSVPQRP